MKNKLKNAASKTAAFASRHRAPIAALTTALVLTVAHKADVKLYTDFLDDTNQTDDFIEYHSISK